MQLHLFCSEHFIRFTIHRYMKGRLTLDKVNAAINDMAAYADTNSQLITAPRKKVPFCSYVFGLPIKPL